MKDVIQKNPCYAQLSETLQRALMKGERPSILTHDEILQRMGQFDPKMRGYFRFLSSHVHSHPLAYYRMDEHDRGRGVETEGEKGYIASTLELGTDLLTKSTDALQQSFSDIASFASGTTYNWEVLVRRP